MKSHSGSGNRLSIWMLLSVVAMIAACGTISPRRIVSNNPSVSPSPTETPTISPTPTVTPTPTPTGMAAVVPNEFLFTANPGAGLILGFKINRDGGLSAVPGSPFASNDAPRLVAEVRNNLLAAGQAKLTAFVVDKETGTIKKTDAATLHSITSLVTEPASGTVLANTPNGRVAIRVVNNKLQFSPESASVVEAEGMSGTTVKDATGKFAFVLDSSTGTITAFSTQDGGHVASSKFYSAGRGASSMALVIP